MRRPISYARGDTTRSASAAQSEACRHPSCCSKRAKARGTCPRWPSRRPTRCADTLINTDPGAPRARRSTPRPRRRKSPAATWGLVGVLVTPALIVLVIVLFVVGTRENEEAGKRLFGTWEVDLDELARQGAGAGVGAGFLSGENAGDSLRAAGIRIGVRFQKDKRVFIDSRTPDESEQAWGSWKVERAKKTSMRVSIDWDDGSGVEVMDIEFLSSDRFEAESAALFDNTTMVFQRLAVSGTANR